MKSDLYAPLIDNLTAKADFTDDQLETIKDAFNVMGDPEVRFWVHLLISE